MSMTQAVQWAINYHVKNLRALPYDQYLKTPHWQRTRERVLRWYGRRCAKCGATERLEVHHKTYERLGCELMADLEILCEKCHSLLTFSPGHDKIERAKHKASPTPE
jgi:5-methylcytosine-specific restriction endonuclease McrA